MLEWVAAATGIPAGSLSLAPLAGAFSSSLFTVAEHGGPARFVLRCLHDRAWLEAEPDLAAHEAAALELAARLAIAAPTLVAYEASPARFGAALVLMTFVEGRVELPPAPSAAWLAGLARALVAVHAHDADGFPWRYRSWVPEAGLTPPAVTRAPALWARAIDRARAPAPAAPSVFLHRDYHPLNVLWQQGAPSAVVDWINACRGPAAVDVAHCRANLATLYGLDAAERFASAYRAEGGGEHDPYWDLDAVLGFASPEPRFHSPWLAFGVERLGPATIAERLEALLGSALART